MPPWRWPASGHSNTAIAGIRVSVLCPQSVQTGMLRHPIWHRVQRSQQARRGCCVQQIAGSPRQHARYQSAGREHVAHDVHPPAHVPVGIIGVSCPLRERTRVGEEHVDGPKFGFGRGDQRSYLGLLRNIRRHGKSADLALRPLASRSPDVLRSATTTPRAPACA